MPRRIFSFDTPDRLLCGALGQPGKRSFFMQAVKGGTAVSVGLEKAQVAILAERLATLLLALRQGGVAIADEPIRIPGAVPTLAEPIVEQFRVGTLTLGWDGEAQTRRHRGARDRRRGPDDEDDDDEEEARPKAPTTSPPACPPWLPSSTTRATSCASSWSLRPRWLLPAALWKSSAPAGRRARMCGAPLDPTGHFCVGRNGHTDELIN